MLVTFTQNFGSHQKGAEADVPEQVANNLLRVGVVVKNESKAEPKPDSVPTPNVSKTEPYRSPKGIGRAIKKAG